jgi:histidine triad (HIT) family protein
MKDENCIFCKIVAGEIPASIIKKTNQVTVFNDITPQAPTHILVIPNQHFSNMAQVAKVDPSLVGEIFAIADQVAAELGIDTYRSNINTGAGAGQSVFHAHLHLLAGRAFSWPPG